MVYRWYIDSSWAYNQFRTGSVPPCRFCFSPTLLFAARQCSWVKVAAGWGQGVRPSARGFLLNSRAPSPQRCEPWPESTPRCPFSVPAHWWRSPRNAYHRQDRDSSQTWPASHSWWLLARPHQSHVNVRLACKLQYQLITVGHHLGNSSINWGNKMPSKQMLHMAPAIPKCKYAHVHIQCIYIYNMGFSLNGGTINHRNLQLKSAKLGWFGGTLI